MGDFGVILALRLNQHVFIPFQAAAVVLIPTGTGLPADNFGDGDVVAALSLGTYPHVFSLNGVIAHK